MRYRAIAALGLLSCAAAAWGFGLLIEMEKYDSKQPDSDEFALAATEPHASRRRVLYKFFPSGQVKYRFRAPAAGEYAIWLRYGSKNAVSIRVAIDGRGKPHFEAVTVPPTGGYVGPGVWGWAKLWSGRLSAGEHSITVGNAAMRPDCLYITDQPQTPTDELITTDWSAMLTEKQKRLLARPLCPVRPDWLDGAMEYQLPAWYDRYRVHAHTRFGPRWMDKPVFFQVADAFQKMGVHTFARHIKSGSEPAWWPSKVGAVLPITATRNVAKQIIDNAHRNGQRILVYHRHMEDAYMAQQHPEWVCRDSDGKPYHRRGYQLCFNSPYPDYVLARMLELVELGADGLYFDEVHMPKPGCWCDFCQRRFKEESGLDHPPYPDVGNPIWRKLQDFNNLTIERTFVKWRKALHAANPELVMLVGSNTWPGMTDRHMTNRLFRIADSMKTEFSLPARASSNRIFQSDKSLAPPETDVRIALGYTLARDACDGRPAHIWTFGLLDEASTLYASSGMMTHGCIANLDIREDTVPNMMYRAAFALGDRVSPYLAGTKPVRWAAIHYSELTRDEYAADESEKWRQVLYPVYGAYRALLRAHLPVGIITDSQLEEGLLDGYHVLFLPAPRCLTEKMQEQVEVFRRRGGLVVEQRPEWKWHQPNGGVARAGEKLLQALSSAVDAAPVRAFGGPEKMHVVSFIHPETQRLTVMLCNDFAWVHTGRPPKDPGEIERLTHTPPPCQGVRLRLPRTPQRLREIVLGRDLQTRATDGAVEVDVPQFDYLATVVVD